MNNLLSMIQGVPQSQLYQDALGGYETYMGVTQEDARTQQAQLAKETATEEARTMRILAGAGVAVALAALIVSVIKR